MNQSNEILRKRAIHAQRMMELSPNGNGFRRVPEHSNQVSIVERYFIALGDIKGPPLVPNDRNYRRKRRPLNARQERRVKVANKEAELLKPVQHRRLSLEPNNDMIDKVLAAYPTKSPAHLVSSIINQTDFDSIPLYDRAVTRVERFMKNSNGKRMPSHIRDRFILKQVVEKCLAKRFGV